MNRGMGRGAWGMGILGAFASVGVLPACAPRVVPDPIPPSVSPAPATATPAPVVPAAPAPVVRPAEGTIDGGAGSLYYHIVGRGADTVIVPLGTWLESSLQSLGERFTVVFYDPRHRGRSHPMTDSLAATFDGDVADLEAIRRALGSPRVALIGYDYYAAVAAAWAAANPQAASRLVLLSPIEPTDSLARAFNPPERMARIDTVAARALVKARAAGRDTSDLARYCEDFWRLNAVLFVGDTTRTRVAWSDWCRLPNESPARIAAASGFAMSSLGSAPDFAGRAAGVRVPTLMIQGRLDLVANPEGAREWARRISGARVLWLPNVGHLPFVEDRETVVAALRAFLGGEWPPRAGPP
jgi:proline iminopeptidase